MKALVLILALALSLSGCAVCQRNPTACAAITFVAVGCGTLILHNHHSGLAHDVQLDPPNCANGSCK